LTLDAALRTASVVGTILGGFGGNIDRPLTVGGPAHRTAARAGRILFRLVVFARMAPAEPLTGAPGKLVPDNLSIPVGIQPPHGPPAALIAAVPAAGLEFGRVHSAVTIPVGTGNGASTPPGAIVARTGIVRVLASRLAPLSTLVASFCAFLRIIEIAAVA
jgi:hypothetical protein